MSPCPEKRTVGASRLLRVVHHDNAAGQGTERWRPCWPLCAPQSYVISAGTRQQGESAAPGLECASSCTTASSEVGPLGGLGQSSALPIFLRDTLTQESERKSANFRMSIPRSTATFSLQLEIQPIHPQVGGDCRSGREPRPRFVARQAAPRPSRPSPLRR
jgi:hypothetical protein